MLWSRPASEWSRAGARASAFLPGDEEQAAVDNWQLSAHGTHFQGPKQDLGGSYSPNPLPRTGLKLTLKAMAMSQR